MRIEIKGLAEWRARLAQVRPAELMAQALAEQAEALAETVRERLSEPPGAGSHDAPWARTGALRESIGSTASGLEAAIGSNDPAAAPQELGTSRIPPRPFLAPVAAAAGQGIATSVGKALAQAFQGDVQSHRQRSSLGESATTHSPATNLSRSENGGDDGGAQQ